ncbi:MAG: hypothetical protein M3237_17790 [Actinomycetota bacterium]|nr:hypothetical protein [Actinomycetota bacterium]
MERQIVPTDHGLQTGTLVWADHGRLLVEFGQLVGGEGDSMNDQSTAVQNGLFLWDVQGGEALTEIPRQFSAHSLTVTGEGRFVVQTGNRSYGLVDLDEPQARQSFRMNGNISSMPVVDPSGRRLAAVWGGPRGRNPNDVVVAPLAPIVEHSTIPGSGGTFRVLTWLADDRIIVERRTGTMRDAVLGASVFAVDVDTGESDEIVQLRSIEDVFGIQFATQLFGSPTVEAAEPASPMDPRLTAGLVGGTMVVAVLGMVLWRRRVRP